MFARMSRLVCRAETTPRATHRRYTSGASDMEGTAMRLIDRISRVHRSSGPGVLGALLLTCSAIVAGTTSADALRSEIPWRRRGGASTEPLRGYVGRPGPRRQPRGQEPEQDGGPRAGRPEEGEAPPEHQYLVRPGCRAGRLSVPDPLRSRGHVWRDRGLRRLRQVAHVPEPRLPLERDCDLEAAARRILRAAR